MERIVGIVPRAAIFIPVLCLCSVARSGPIFVLSPEPGAEPFAGGGRVVTWEEDGGRYGGPALKIARASDHLDAGFLLFEEPQLLVTAGRYRAEAWVKVDKGDCRIDLVLYDAETGAERGRYAIASQKNGSPPGLPDRHFGWRYGACDVPLENAGDGVRFNIEVLDLEGTVFLDGLKVIGPSSILPRGDFREIEKTSSREPGTSAGGTLAGVPRGWRRKYDGANRGKEADGVFGVERTAAGNVLVVQKNQGPFVLSAEPIPVPEKASAFIARARVDKSPDLLPTIVFRQYGRQGLLREGRSDKVLRRAGETVVSTQRIENHPEAERILFLLRFPEEAGTYRVRSVEVSSPAMKSRDIEILVDQVGYNDDEPFRFIVAACFFPTEGPGAFRLRSTSGRTYEKPLVPMGRAVGQNESDWGRYYFEGIVAAPAPGTYVLSATLGSRSASVEPVTVGPRLRLRETGALACRFYFVQRCGYAVAGWHGPCHMDDAKLPDGTHVDVTGGYHNAGDFHKHMMDNTPVSVYGMICAYESCKEFFDAIDMDGNGRADLLDEAIWGADWLQKMVDPKTGRIWMNVTNDIDYYGIPERDTDGIPGTGDDRVVEVRDPPDLGAFTIAAWAALSRHVPETDYLDVAEKLWSVYEHQIVTGYNPRHVFSALELCRATRSEKYRLAGDRLVRNLLDLQNEQGWFARRPHGGPEFKLVDEGTTPAALARYALAQPKSALANRVKDGLRKYFLWSLRMADNPFGLIRNYTGGEPLYFTSRDEWFGGGNSQYCSVAWAAYLAARVFEAQPKFSLQLRAHAANQVHWIMGMNPLSLCMFEGKGNSSRIHYHHLYAEIPGHPRGAVPGAIPNGIAREPSNADRPWFDLRSKMGSLPGAESAEPWLPHNAYYLLMLSAGG